MIPKGLFSQIALLVIGAAIVITYIRPMFDEIQNNQDQIATYQSERGKVESFNQALADRLRIIDEVFAADRERLLTYMPDQVDPIAVMRDLESIAEANNVIVESISDNGSLQRDRSQRSVYTDANQSDSRNAGPYAYSFGMSVTGSYEQIKAMLDRLDRNQYPLQVQLLEMTGEEGGFISASLNILTYSNLPTVETTNLFQDVNVIYE